MGAEAHYREPYGRHEWQRAADAQRIGRRKVERHARDDRAAAQLESRVIEIVAELKPGRNNLPPGVFGRVVRWILLDQDERADRAIARGRLVMGNLDIRRHRGP